MKLAEVRRTIDAKGRVRFATFDAGIPREEILARRAKPVDERVNANLMMQLGLSQWALAINWAMIQNQNTGWGNPYSAPNLGNAYGAVGTSNLTPAGGQNALVAEVGRVLITNAAVAQNVLIYDYFFGVTQGIGSINEVGMLLQASLVVPTLTTGLTSGNTYTTLAVTSTAADIPSGSTVIIGYTSGQVQTVTTASDTPPSSTAVAVTSFIANATYPVGTVVGYIPGTMLDRSTFVTPVIKTGLQTALLEVQFTLVSG